ncbi:glycosyl transferase family 1, partial [Mesorhizobium sp. M7A.F.Ca.US.011.01.1.1]
MNAAFGDNGIMVSLGARSIEPCQYLVATGWQTAYWVAKYRDTAKRLYFVQDFEPAFYAHGTEYILAENTYRLGLIGITAGKWLADKLRHEYGMHTIYFNFACDLDLYRPHERRPSKTKHIFFYARPVTPRRCFELGLLALKRVCDQMPDTAVIFAGWDVGGYEIPFHHLNAGTVAVPNLPDLYSQCDIG